MYQIVEPQDSDRDAFVRLAWKAFEPTLNLSDLKKETWVNYWNCHELEDWAYVAKFNDQLVANLSFFKNESNLIRGSCIPFAGVWAVATEPAHRRKGLVRKLFQKAFPKMREKGMCLSILDPFNITFYERFGYARAEQRALHEFHPRVLRCGNPNPDIIAEECNDPDTWKELIELENSMTRYGSRAFHLERAARPLIKGPHFYYFKKNDEIVGSMKLAFRKENGDLVLDVSNCFYINSETLTAMVSLIYHHAVNVEKVKWHTDFETPVHYFFKSHNVTSKSTGSMMMRVVDILPYLDLIKIPKTSNKSITIELVDDFCQWNSGIYKLSPSDGKIVAEEINNPSEHHIKLDGLQLSRIISGLTTATQLRGFGLIDCSREVVERIESMFPAESFYTYMRF